MENILSLRTSTLEGLSYGGAGVDGEALEEPCATSSQMTLWQNQPTSSAGPSRAANTTEGVLRIVTTC